MGVSENRVYTKNKSHFDGGKHDQQWAVGLEFTDTHHNC